MAISIAKLDVMRDTLFAGRYSLFLGAGASFGSRTSAGADVPLSEALRSKLVELKGLKSTSSLARAYAQLSQSEIDTHITDVFSNCSPGAALKRLPNFSWKQVFTLNVDDALEVAYAGNSERQSLEPKTHKSPFSSPSNVNILQVIHVHGWAKIPEDGYVFSLAEYARAMGPSSPWTTVLAHSLASEPFIVAGTSLEEPDLEYFLAGRNAGTVRKDRGPSFLIEPYPDSGTERECERHGLDLYVGTFDEFLSELEAHFPSRPLPANAAASLTSADFVVSSSKRELALFGRDFEYVVSKHVEENADLGFYVGRAPALSDISLQRDISRRSTVKLESHIRAKLKQSVIDKQFLIVDDNAGTGKEYNWSQGDF